MEVFTLVIFGITSNLAQLKLIPALYLMEEKGLLPKKMSIVGIARRPISDQEFRDYFYKTLVTNRKIAQYPKEKVCKNLIQRLFYLDGDVEKPDLYQRLHEKLHKLSKGSKHNVIYYLATYPTLYKSIFHNLQKNGLNQEKNGWVRLMIEKPLGTDLVSARKLNRQLKKYFFENQIYRLDHYLGKETVQNILTFRFGNGIFEPLLNSRFVDHIQITSAEDFGIGNRGGYYDTTGILKDVGQNHLLQVLSFAVMDAPKNFTNEDVTRERIKVLKNLKAKPDDIVFGQYEGYKKEENVSNQSSTDTFFALKTSLNNHRFKDVPIYIRAGKKLAQTVTEVSIVFKTPINRLFKDLKSGMEPNVLTYRIQPDEGIVLSILAKAPEHELKLEQNYMQFCYHRPGLMRELPDPYVRLILDAIRGDQTFFTDAEEVEREWAFIDPFVKIKRKVFSYKSGSWGPKEADRLIAIDGRSWLNPSPFICTS